MMSVLGPDWCMETIRCVHHLLGREHELINRLSMWKTTGVIGSTYYFSTWGLIESIPSALLTPKEYRCSNPESVVGP